MHCFKRLTALLLTVLVICALLLPTQAAVISAGENDMFFRRHAGECLLDGGSYHLNGMPGYVSVLRSPESEQAVDYLLNERLVTVYCTWTDGRGSVWGQLRYNSTGRGLAFCEEGGASCGWVRMDELVSVYGRESFLADHLGEFEFGEVQLDTTKYKSVGVWQFPGCGGKSSPASWYMRSDREAVLIFPAVWTDSLGRRWGSCRFDTAVGFICIDEPALMYNRLPEIDTGYLAIPAADAVSLPQAAVSSAGPEPWVYPLITALLSLMAAIYLEIISDHSSGKKKESRKR